MTALDPFTAATTHYADAVRSLRPFKQGSALEVMPGRFRWHVVAAVVGGALGLLCWAVVR